MKKQRLTASLKKPPLKPRHSRLHAVGIISLLAIAAIAAAMHIRSLEHEHYLGAEAKKVAETLDLHHSYKQNIRDAWWLTTAPSASQESLDLFTRQKDRVIRLLDAYKDVSPDTQKIAARASVIHSTLFYNDIQLEISVKGTSNSWPSNAMSICFLPRNTAEKANYMLPTYNTALDAVVLPGIEIPDKLYAAVLFHEFGHALRHNRFDGNPKDPDGGDDYIGEEVTMHQLGGTVLNATSGGEYDRRIAEIIARAPKGSHWSRAIAEINENDCDAFDAMFDCSDKQTDSNVVITQCALDIGLHYCDLHRLGMKEKIAVYRWFDRYIFTVKVK